MGGRLNRYSGGLPGCVFDKLKVVMWTAYAIDDLANLMSEIVLQPLQSKPVWCDDSYAMIGYRKTTRVTEPGFKSSFPNVVGKLCG